jgi:hypothetical protein
MASLREYFDNDFTNINNISNTVVNSQNLPAVEIQARLHEDFPGNSKYISFYIPKHPAPLTACINLMKDLSLILHFDKQIEGQMGFVGERQVHSSELVFTGRVFFYSESDISEDEFELLRRKELLNDLHIHLRGNKYARERSKLEKPIAFICHDSRDKDIVARPIAFGLSKLMCPVWYDEFSLKVGDRLRESIERGLKECKKCVLVLSRNFLSNTGWTKVEFNSIFTRELIEKEDFLLPVWHGVTKEEVFNYSPSLSDRVGVDWKLGDEEVVRRLYRSIR